MIVTVWPLLKISPFSGDRSCSSSLILRFKIRVGVGPSSFLVKRGVLGCCGVKSSLLIGILTVSNGRTHRKKDGVSRV